MARKNGFPSGSDRVRKAGRNAGSPGKTTHKRREPSTLAPSIGCHVSSKIELSKPPQYVPFPPRTRSYRATTRYRRKLQELGLAA